MWKEMGRPNCPNNRFLQEKKSTAQNFRRECRKESAIKRVNNKQKLIQARTSDRNSFFKMIRKQRGSNNRQIDKLTVENTTYENNNIMQGWGSHFQKLALRTGNKDYDLEHLEKVEQEVKIITEICEQNFCHQPITVDKMKKAVMTLNRNKAADFYGIKAENILHGGDSLLQFLQELLNRVFESGEVSDILKIGTLFPVYKNKGDHKDAKFYRGITVTPIYSKIIEKIIKLRENSKIIDFQNPLQRGFTENTSPLLCELFIEEFERENKDLKLPTYIAFLDGKSAFDVVVHANLTRRLFQMGLSYQSILLIKSLYDNASSCIKWNGLYSILAL